MTKKLLKDKYPGALFPVPNWVKDEDEAGKLDKWRRECYERDDGKCQITGGPAGSTHHIIKRRYECVKFDSDNGICVTGQMHTYFENNPGLAIQMIKVAIGPERFKRLREKFKAAENGHDYFAKWENDD